MCEPDDCISKLQAQPSSVAISLCTLTQHENDTCELAIGCLGLQQILNFIQGNAIHAFELIIHRKSRADSTAVSFEFCNASSFSLKEKRMNCFSFSFARPVQLINMPLSGIQQVKRQGSFTSSCSLSSWTIRTSWLKFSTFSSLALQVSRVSSQRLSDRHRAAWLKTARRKMLSQSR